MAIRKILFANDPRLRQKAKKVRNFGPDIKKLADDMLETMHNADGVGLAGPQIGIMQRIFVAEIPVDDENPQPDAGKPFVFINPEIIQKSSEMEEGKEGCLSLPNWIGCVNRPKEVEIRAKTVRGKNIRLKLSGLLARVFQHELDHLDGTLFTDYIKDPEKLWQVTAEQAGEETEAESVPDPEKETIT